jgi:hypothetical protein
MPPDRNSGSFVQGTGSSGSFVQIILTNYEYKKLMKHDIGSLRLSACDISQGKSFFESTCDGYKGFIWGLCSLKVISRFKSAYTSHIPHTVHT